MPVIFTKRNQDILDGLK